MKRIRLFFTALGFGLLLATSVCAAGLFGTGDEVRANAGDDALYLILILSGVVLVSLAVYVFIKRRK